MRPIHRLPWRERLPHSARRVARRSYFGGLRKILLAASRFLRFYIARVIQRHAELSGRCLLLRPTADMGCAGATQLPARRALVPPPSVQGSQEEVSEKRAKTVPSSYLGSVKAAYFSTPARERNASTTAIAANIDLDQNEDWDDCEIGVPVVRSWPSDIWQCHRFSNLTWRA